MKDVEQIGARRGPLRRGCVRLDRESESERVRRSQSASYAINQDKRLKKKKLKGP